jgi:hypothetical protein
MIVDGILSNDESGGMFEDFRSKPWFEFGGIHRSAVTSGGCACYMN